jgi:DNA-binding protein HU-beta
MDKRQLITMAARRSPLTQRQVGAALDAILGTISCTLAEGGWVTLSGFGRFEVKPYPGRRLRRFGGDGHYTVEDRSVPVFKSSAALRRRLRRR